MYRLFLIILIVLGSVPSMAVETPGRTRVAILPFETPKEQKDLEQYGVGTMDSMIQALSNIPQFVMVDRARIEHILKEQAFAQTGLVDPKSAVTVGKMLQAQVLVMGNLIKAGDKVRITAHFTDMTTGQISHSEAVTGPVEGIFDLMDQLSAKFLANENVPVTAQQQQRIEKVLKSTAKLTAYDHYLKGRKAFLLFTPDGYKEAIKWYQQAIDEDPKYALAYAALGELWVYWGWQKQVNGEPHKHEFEEAYAASEKALALNPDLPDAQRAFGRSSFFLGKLDQAGREQAARKALALNPNDAETWYELWYASGNFNNPDHEYIRKALELNPDLAAAHASRGWPLYVLKRYDEALAEYQQALRINPKYAWAHSNLGLVLVAQQRYDEAITAYQEAIRLDPDFAWAHYNLSYAYWAKGRLADTVRELEETLRIDPNHQEALQWLPQARAKLKSGQ